MEAPFWPPVSAGLFWCLVFAVCPNQQSRVIEMLQRGQGSTIAAIVKATGLRPQSVRGFFAGVVRKKLGLALVSQKTGTDRVYRIARAQEQGECGQGN